MKLNSIYIDGYKNLIDTSINFQASSIPIAIIGNNGTGKSNLIETLIHIFIGLYYDKLPDFDFRIEYEAHNKQVLIDRQIRKNYFSIKIDGNPIGRYLFKKRIRETGNMPPFPALLFCYYSGTCERTKNLITKYNRTFLIKIRKQTKDLERLFVFSDIDHAGWCLLGLIAHRDRVLLNRLSLNGINKFNLILNAPETYSPEVDEPSYWGITGALRDFMADLDNLPREKGNSFHLDASTGFQQQRKYILTTNDLMKIGALLDQRKTNLYSMLQALEAKKMLHTLEFKVVHAESGVEFGVEDLSEGEKQLLSVIGGLKLSHQNECLVLLDEPDTHLNPAWSWEYDNILKEALRKEQQNSSTVILATHDPIMISGLTKEQVLIAKLVGGRLIYENPLRNPRGQGVANLLTSEYFGLPSSLDKNTQDLLDERLTLAFKPDPLSEFERKRLGEINDSLQELGLTISFRDPDYAKFERERYDEQKTNQ